VHPGPTAIHAPSLHDALPILALAPAFAAAYDQNRIATGPDGKPVRIQGSVVVIEPDLELSLVTAGGLEEPRRAWSEAARQHYPRSEEHTSELQSRENLVCRLL